jgi:hypothetical protein
MPDFNSTYGKLLYKKIKAGFEYSIQINTDMIGGKDHSWLSVHASGGLAEKFSIVTRYDYLNSSHSSSQNQMTL